MITIAQSDNSGNSGSTGEFLMDEFLPYIEYKDVDIENKNEVNIKFHNSKFQFSKYLDKSYQQNYPFELTTEKRKFKISFQIKKGCDDSYDDDGILKLKLSSTDNEIKVGQGEDIKAKYNSELELDVECLGKEKKEFAIDFFASDDNIREWNEGELKDVHCGRIYISIIVRKKTYYAISLMTEVDYRSDALNIYRPGANVKVANQAFTPVTLRQYLNSESENVKKNEPSFSGGEAIHFLALFSHGVQNEIFGSNHNYFNKAEIKTIFSSIYFSENSLIYLGACNAGTGLKTSFAQELAEVTSAEVIAMTSDGVAPVHESTGKVTNPQLIYGPKFGRQNNGNFYKFTKGATPVLYSEKVDVLSLLDSQMKRK
jgi:hypothetical protein